MKKYLELLQITFKEWNEDNVPRLAASLAYYTALSLAPLLLVMLALLAFFFGDEAARGQIVDQFSGELGVESAEFIQELIQDSSDEEKGIFSTVISVVMLLAGATGVFMQLQSALNEVWDIEVKSGGIKDMIQKRVLSFGLIMTLAFLLLISLVINGVIASLDTFFIGILPGAQILGHLITTTISFGVSTLLFAIIYKYMPDATIHWRDVLVGAVVTSILFTVGRFALSLYLGNAGVASSYGAAGSFIVILLWVYYSAQIVMFGAEFTQVYARRYGSQIVPEEGAEFNISRQLAMNNIDMDDIQDEILEKEQENKQDAIPEITEKLPESDRPIVLENAEITHYHKPEPDYTLIVSSLVAAISAGIGWFIGRRRTE